jgi:glycosyltransferase involved in cell wall biosynthesis
MIKKMTPKIIFAGAVQNSAIYLPSVLNNIENISRIASEVAFVFVENDSIDNTKQILSDWGSKRSDFYLINLDGLNVVPIRTIRLERARNAYIETIKFHEKLHKFDFLIILDMDDKAVCPIDLQEFLSAICFLENFKERAAVFANQRGTYDDMWALRHSAQCPTDAWEEVLDYIIKHKCSDEVAFNQTFSRRIFHIKESSEPVKVESAFGGLGIYKMDYVLKNKNPYLGSKTKIIPLDSGGLAYAQWQLCEHVNFHAGIKNQGGDMYILPKLINGTNPGLIFPPSTFRQFIF